MVAVEAAETNKRTKREKRKSRVRLTEAQAVLGWGVLLALISVLGAIYLFQTSRIATTGRMVQELQFDLNETKRVNSELERDIAEAQSLERLQTEAAKLGFTKARPSDIEYLIVKNYPETESTEMEPETAQREPLENIGQAIWQIVTGNFDGMVRGESQ